MKLIVGLGNPGKEYEITRHNAGFMAIDEYAKKNNLEFKSKLDGLYSEKIINGEKVIFLKPQNYINLSGDVIYKYINYYKIDIADILIIHDDMNLDVGSYKIRYKGGSAGHNGLKNIEANLHTQEYKRIKVGISKNKNIDMVDYVIGKMGNEDLNKIKPVLEKITNIIDDFISISFDNLMNKYN